MGAMSFQYDRRVDRARDVMAEEGLAAVIVGPGAEMRYFTGRDIFAHERLACVVVTHESVRVVAPATDQPGGWRDGEDPYRAIVDTLPAGDVGLGSSLLAPHVLRFQALIDGRTRLVPAQLFAVKEDAEIAELRRAARAIDEVHRSVPSFLRAGRTEEEVAADLRDAILREHRAVDFVIVGAGANGANPHHSCSPRVLAPGDPVVVDIGGTLKSGYHSDCTRTYVVPGAEPSEDFRRAYDAVRAGYEAALDACRPGITAGELDAAAREVIADAGYGRYFSHRLGHGIGLAGHERPWIVGGDATVLRENMVFSVEPGVYVPGEWGIRIEDIVAVTADGSLTLNILPTGL